MATSWKRRIVGLLAALAAPSVVAEPYRVTTILSDGVALPGGRPGETLQALGRPALDGADLAFSGVSSTGVVGLYLLTPDEGLTEVVRTGSRPPGQPENVQFLHVDQGLALSDRRVSFFGEWFIPNQGGGTGIYLWEDGVLRVVADSTGPPLPGIGVASNFWPAFEPSSTLVFRAVHSGSSMAIIRELEPGNFETVLDTHGQAPWENPGTNVGRVGALFSNEEGLTFVGAAGGSAQLIRRAADGTWQALTDHLETPTPGLPGAFLFVEDIVSGPPTLIGSDVAFRSRSFVPPGPHLVPGAGIYRSRGNSLEVVADGSTPHPISGLPFNAPSFSSHPSGGSRHLSFRGRATGTSPFGLYVVGNDGEWTVLAEQGGLFADRPVVSVNQSHQAWDGERLAVSVIHPEGSTLYVVDFGQPSVIEVPTSNAAGLATLGLVLTILGLATIRRRTERPMKGFFRRSR